MANNNFNFEWRMLFDKINNGSPYFIFNVSNNSNFSNGKSRLTIEVSRVALENIKLPETKEIYVNQWYINIFINTLTWAINEGSYIIEGIKQELYHSISFSY
ncbi:hypothetical protein ID0992_08160 [Helicobacter pylori]